MSIPGLEAIGAISASAGTSAAYDLYAAAAGASASYGPSATGYISDAATSQSAASGGFGAVITGAVNNLAAMQHKSSQLGVAAVSGELEDVHQYTIASTEAQVALELTAAIRNQAVQAFNEIMRMQA